MPMLGWLSGGGGARASNAPTRASCDQALTLPYQDDARRDWRKRASCGILLAATVVAASPYSHHGLSFALGQQVAKLQFESTAAASRSALRGRSARHTGRQFDDRAAMALGSVVASVGVMAAVDRRRHQASLRKSMVLLAEASDSSLPPPPAYRGRVGELERAGQLQAGTPIEGIVKQVRPFGVFIDAGFKGKNPLIEVAEWNDKEDVGFPKNYFEEAKAMIGKKMTARVLRVRGIDIFLTRRPGPLKRKFLNRADRKKDQVDDEAVLSFLDVPPATSMKGQVVSMMPWGVYVSMMSRNWDDKRRVEGLLHMSHFAEGFAEQVELGQEVRVRVLQVDPAKANLLLTMLEPGSVENTVGPA